jgi:hypothetical protein
VKNSYYLLNPVFLWALSGLLFNDFYLKAAFPSVLSGKLSDVCGLIVFALFFTFILKDKFKTVVFVASALLFCWWKSDLSSGFISSWNGLFSFYALERTVDYADLICLPVLVPVYFYHPQKGRFNATRQWITAPVLLLSVFAIAATSKARNISAYSNTQKYFIDETFRIKQVSYADFLQQLSLSNMTVEKNTDAAPPSKRGDYHYYTLRNFELTDQLIVESMHIGVKEKNKNLKVLIQDVTLFDPPEKSEKEMKKLVMEVVEEFFDIGK